MSRWWCLMAIALLACMQDNSTDILEQYLWKNRLLLVFSPDDDNSFLQKQLQSISENEEGVLDRDMVIFTVVRKNGVVSQKNKQKELTDKDVNLLRQKFDVKESNFEVILIGKDGTQKLRYKNKTISSKMLFRTIDAMPMRQREMKHQNALDKE